MSIRRPSLLNGYLGPQVGFKELGLSTKSHKDPEFETRENEFVIRLVVSKPVKITTKVINESNGKESQERVFTQTRGNDVSLLVSLDTLGYHKLQIYALPASEESKQLPGVFNYLINCTGMPRKSRVFPKQFARWKDGCALLEPFSLASESLSGDVSFRVIIPEARAAAIVIGDVWTHLEPGDKGMWYGRVQAIQNYKGRGLCAVLNGNFDDDDETRYISLLQYAL